MAQVTTLLPAVNTEGYFSFKEPYASYLNRTFNTNIETVVLKLVSVATIKDLVINNNIDPYITIYRVAGVQEIQYRNDAINDVHILTFSYTIGTDIRLFRIPHSFLSKVITAGTVLYKNKLFVIDVGKLPADVSFSEHHNDLKEFIKSKVGTECAVKEVTIGEGTFVSIDDSNVQETIRQNNRTFNDTYMLKYNKLMVEYNRLKQTYENLLKKYAVTP